MRAQPSRGDHRVLGLGVRRHDTPVGVAPSSLSQHAVVLSSKLTPRNHSSELVLLSCMSHLLIEADDCLCVNQLLGHDQVESGDLIELVPSLLAIETSDFVIKSWQTDV